MSSPGGCFRAAFEVLSGAGIEALLLRDDPSRFEELDEVDLLVPRAKLRAAVRALEGAGWELSDGGLFHPCKRALLRWQAGSLRKLDLHAELIDEGLVYLDAGWAFEGARRDASGALVPRDEPWFLHVLLHTLLAKPRLAEKHRARVAELRARGLGQAEMLAQAARYGLRSVAAELLADPIAVLGDARRVAELRRRARRRLLLRPANALRSLRLAIAWPLGQALGLRRGFFMAVIGPDGAGKTSFIAALIGELERQGIPARTVYMGPWEPTRLWTSRFLARLGASPLDDLPGTGPDFPPAVRRQKRLKGLTKRQLWYASALLDLWARYLGHVLPRLLLRRVVIADRYAHDLEVGYYNALVTNSPRLRRALVRLAPCPRTTVLLDGEADLVHSRKREYPLEVIERALSAYRALGERHGLRVLRSDRPAELLAREYARRHWRELVRWRRDGIRPRTGRWPLPEGVRVEWIASAAELRARASDWDQAVRASGLDEPYLLSDFLLTWLRHYGDGRELRMALVLVDGELAGGLPLYAERRGRKLWLRYPGADDHALANRTNLFAARDFALVVEAVVGALAERRDWQMLELPRLYLDQARLARLRAVLARHGLLLLHEQSFPGYRIDVPASFDEFLRERPKGFRNKLRRAERRAAEEGELVLEEVSGEEALRALLADYVAMSRASHAARGGRSSFEDERLCAFFADLLVRFDSLGLAHAHGLRLAGRRIAIGLGFSSTGNLNDVLTTFDPSAAEVMPGNLMTRAQLQLAIERGMPRIDFASGASPHKERWATRTEPVQGILVGRGGLARRIAHAPRLLARSLLRRARAAPERAGGEPGDELA